MRRYILNGREEKSKEKKNKLANLFTKDKKITMR